MYVLGIQYKEKWNKMAAITVARCKFILAKSNMCTISSMLKFVPGKLL